MSFLVWIEWNKEIFECVLLLGFFFVGEGVGYVGGIVSVVVDGMYVGFVFVK